jgi:hypothetical protein
MVLVEVETADDESVKEAAAKAPPGINVTLKDESAQRGAFESSVLLQFAIEFGAGVSSGLVTEFIIHSLKGRANRVRVNGQVVSDETTCKDAIDKSR